jgi:hypothetical protein
VESILPKACLRKSVPRWIRVPFPTRSSAKRVEFLFTRAGRRAHGQSSRWTTSGRWLAQELLRWLQ